MDVAMIDQERAASHADDERADPMVLAFRLVGDRPFDEEVAKRCWAAFRGFGAPPPIATVGRGR